MSPHFCEDLWVLQSVLWMCIVNLHTVACAGSLRTANESHWILECFSKCFFFKRNKNDQRIGPGDRSSDCSGANQNQVLSRCYRFIQRYEWIGMNRGPGDSLIESMCPHIICIYVRKKMIEMISSISSTHSIIPTLKWMRYWLKCHCCTLKFGEDKSFLKGWEDGATSSSKQDILKTTGLSGKKGEI